MLAVCTAEKWSVFEVYPPSEVSQAPQTKNCRKFMRSRRFLTLMGLTRQRAAAARRAVSRQGGLGTRTWRNSLSRLCLWKVDDTKLPMKAGGFALNDSSKPAIDYFHGRDCEGQIKTA